jgi:hypothetical protein
VRDLFSSIINSYKNTKIKSCEISVGTVINRIHQVTGFHDHSKITKFSRCTIFYVSFHLLQKHSSCCDHTYNVIIWISTDWNVCDFLDFTGKNYGGCREVKLPVHIYQYFVYIDTIPIEAAQNFEFKSTYIYYLCVYIHRVCREEGACAFNTCISNP